LWGAVSPTNAAEHSFGKGRVVWDRSPREVLAQAGIERDVEAPQLKDDPPLMWIHRRAGSNEIYFVANQRDTALEAAVTFRVKGLVPELWHADTGKIEPAGRWWFQDGRTVVPLQLAPSGSVFVVFRKPAGEVDPVMTVQREGSPDAAGATLSVRDGHVWLHAAESGDYRLKTASGRVLKARVKALPKPQVVEGKWELRFPPHHGAPEKVTLKKLVSWPEHPDWGVSYFSGTATYVKEVKVPSKWISPDQAVILDLGQIKNVASVRLNGQDLGVLWKPPFRVDVTGTLKRGKNRLEIKVTNLWVNRLIGDNLEPADCEWEKEKIFKDVKPPVRAGRPLAKVPEWLLQGSARPSPGRYAFTTFDFFTLGSPLLKSGLLGPVKLEAMAIEKVE
jgi:hypothetical protein